jgi:hypothetical protein
MKSVSRKAQIEVSEVPALQITVTVKARPEMVTFLEAVGMDEQSLKNYMEKILEEAFESMDGCVTGLIYARGQ